MKLRGTLTEEQYRSELLMSIDRLSSADYGVLATSTIAKSVGKVSSAYVLYHLPDQTEDLLDILVNGDRVACLVVEKVPSRRVTKFELLSVAEYEAGIGTQEKIKLAVALDLSQK